jgi:hypothetical protein
VCNSSLWEVKSVKNPLDSLWGTVISGIVITVILYYVAEWIVSRATAGA